MLMSQRRACTVTEGQFDMVLFILSVIFGLGEHFYNLTAGIMDTPQGCNLGFGFWLHISIGSKISTF